MTGAFGSMPADPGGLLREALQVHRRWLEEGSAPAPGELLAKYPHLRDFLEPLLLEEPEPPAEGRVLGEFRLLREIGRGGMGVVYEARQLSLDRPVALKVLSAALALEPRAVARFRREALTAAGLDHPNLVKVLAAGSQGETCFFAMEFAEGAPLDRVLETAARTGLEGLDGARIGALVAAQRHRTSGAALEEPQAGTGPFWGRSHVATAADLALQVARGLDRAHRAGVLHRDVKPSNILVKRDGTALLTDFGLAREAGLPGMTLCGDFVGTPYYASPEQARGKGVDRRSDLFSLGATLYELLTLERPFPGETSHEVLEGILRREPLDPRRRNPRVPADLAAIVLKAMEKEPTRRYQGAGELARDLQAFLEGRPVSARPPSAPARALRWARREPVQAALLLVLALGLPLLAGLGGYILARRGAIELGARVAREQEVEELLAEAFFLQVRRETDSRPLFARILEQDPDNVAALVGLALELCWRKEYAGLREHLDRHASALQGIETVERMRAALRGRTGLPLSASRPVAGGRAGPEREALNLYLQGMDLYGEEVHRGGASRWTEAAERIEEAIRLSPRPRSLFYCGLADVAFQGGLAAPARRAAQALALLWPGSPRARFYQAVALCRVEPALALDLASSLRREGYPQDHVFRDLLALCHLEAGEFERVFAIYAEDLAAHPQDAGIQAQIHLNRGVAWARSGEREKAIACYRQALLCRPDYPLAHANLGKQLLALRLFPESREHLERAHALQPDYGSPLESLAYLCRTERNYAEGVEWASRLLALDPADSENRFLLADLLRRAGRRQEAAAEYRRLLAVEPGQARPLDALGLLEQERPEEALYWFRRAVEADPGRFQGRLNLATTLARMGRHAEALPHLEQALRLDSGHRIALQNLARLYGDLGGEELARPEREAALVSVQDPEPFLALAEARLRAGCPAGCGELVERAERLLAGVPEARRGELEARARALRERL